MTEKLFYKDPYLTVFEASVNSCERLPDTGFAVVLDRTAFFPTGGGQPHDDGTIDGKQVLDVYEKGSVIFHVVSEEISVGKTVTGQIDFDRRFMLMQNHSGEHILSGIIHRRNGYSNVGFHMGSDFITVDFDGPLSGDEISDAEAEANEIIAGDAEIRIFYPSPEELEKLDYRSKKELSGEIRIVEIPGADMCACCGTHVRRTGEIEMVKVVEHMKYKGGTRLFILSGKRALEDYRRKNADIYRISALLSKKPYETAEGVERILAELADKKYECEQLWRMYVKEKTEHITRTDGMLFLVEEGRDNAALRILALAVSERCLAAVVVSGMEHGVTRYILASEKTDVRPLSVALCDRFSGRGGGKPEICQGSLSASPEEISEFIRHQTII